MSSMSETEAQNSLKYTQANLYYEEYLRQVAEDKETERGSDGLAVYERAMEGALLDEQRYGKDDWKPYYHLARLLFLRQQFTLASSYLTRAFDHPTYPHSTREEMKLTQALRDEIKSKLETLNKLATAAEERSRLGPHTSNSPDGAERRQMDIERALSPDILINIMEQGRVADPSLITRMSWVSRGIRRILVEQPSMWQRLVLGRGPRELAKVKTYLERCTSGGARGLTELMITEGYEWEDWGRVKLALIPHGKAIERLTILSDRAGALLRCWKHQMIKLRYLSLGTPANFDDGSMIITNKLDFSLLPPGSSQLKELSLFYVYFRQELDPDDDTLTRESGTFFTNPSTQLANLTMLRLHDCLLAWPVDDIRDILEHTPKIEEVYMEDVTWDCAGFEDPAVRPLVEELPRLEHLTKWCTSWRHPGLYVTGEVQFRSVSAPNLTHLECVFITDSYDDTDDVLFAKGLQETLPKLRHLSLHDYRSNSNLTAAIRKLKSLEYLHLSTRYPSDVMDPLSAITGDTSRPVLPRLIGLSIGAKTCAYSNEAQELILDCDLKSWVNSRLPLSERISSSTDYPESTPALASSTLNLSAGPTPIPSILPLSIGKTPSVFSNPDVARLRYLNIDNCSKVSPGLIRDLEKRIAVVSHRMNIPEGERKVGRDRWEWE